jgi:hypothetical protein
MALLSDAESAAGISANSDPSCMGAAIGKLIEGSFYIITKLAFRAHHQTKPSLA